MQDRKELKYLIFLYFIKSRSQSEEKSAFVQ